MAGKGKDTLNPFRPWKADEGAELQPSIDATYKIFRDTVAQARPKVTSDALLEEYGAKIFTADEALQVGLVDLIEPSRDDALKALVKAAGIKEGTQYQVVTLAQRSWVEQLFSSQSPFVSGHWVHELKLGSETVTTSLR
jgi:ClpP class serine protease